MIEMAQMGIRRGTTRALSRALFPFHFWCALSVICFFSRVVCTGGRRVSARRAGRAELRRKSTKESGVVHRIPARAPRSTGPRRTTGKGIIPAAATARRRRGGPRKDDGETDGRADVQRVRRNNLYVRCEQ